MFEDTKKIEKALQKFLPKDSSKLSQAMRYSVMAGGKRFRPVLCLESAKLFTNDLNAVMPAASAIEMIHTFTLVHDDLPAMDNSDLRRGKPTCHKKYGEDIAILAGDALNTLAFYVVSKYCKPAKSAEVIAELSLALLKVVEGQVVDLESENKKISFKTLQNMHLLKTSALIEASVRIGAVLGNANDADIDALTKYARHLGLAFQITDDILDVTQLSAKLGKPAKLDEKNKKSTYVSLLGLDKAKKISEDHREKAIAEVERFGPKGKTLIDLVNFVLKRSA